MGRVSATARHAGAKEIEQQDRDGFTMLAFNVEPIPPITCVLPHAALNWVARLS